MRTPIRPVRSLANHIGIFLFDITPEMILMKQADKILKDYLKGKLTWHSIQT